MLGTLFRSRDFIKQETELVVIVTPYLVKPTARQELARPLDGLADGDRHEGQLPGSPQPHLRHGRQRRRPAISRATTASSSNKLERWRTYHDVRQHQTLRRRPSARAGSGRAVSLAVARRARARRLQARRQRGRRSPAGRSSIPRSATRSWCRSSRTTMTMQVPRGSHGPDAAAARRACSTSPTATRASDAGNSRLVISAPSGAANEVAAMHAVARDPRICSSDSGFSESVDRGRGLPRRTRDPQPPIRVSYLRYVAEGPECGQLADEPRARAAATCPIPTSAAPRSATSRPWSPIPPICLGPRTETRPARPSAATWSGTSTSRASRPARKKTEDEKVRRQDRPTEVCVMIMTKHAHTAAEPISRRPSSSPIDGDGAERRRRIERARPIPRISIQAFCENPASAEVHAGRGRGPPPVEGARQRAHGRRRGGGRALSGKPDAEPDHRRKRAAARSSWSPSSISSPRAATPAPRSSSSATSTTCCSTASC